MAAMPKVLEGYIEHRLTFIPVDPRKKQKIDVESRQCGRNALGDDKAKQELAEAVGFYLVTTGSSSRSEEYLLSVPQYRIKAVCDAVRFRLRVRLSGYNLIPMVVPSESRKRSKPSVSAPTALLLEVSSKGLEIVSSTKEFPSTDTEKDNFLTLEEMFQQEAQIDGRKKDQESNSSKNKNRKRRYNLVGTVDSVSPLICFNQEPFALIEIYDENSTKAYSSVVVLYGQKSPRTEKGAVSSLVCHEAILPGDVITLKKIQRKPWQVLDAVVRNKMYHLKKRVPSYVFVLREAGSIGWRYPVTEIPSMPSTPVPLVTIQGRVVYTKWCERSRESRQNYDMLHSIEVELLQGQTSEATPTRHIIFLTYYPMAPSLALSLRDGALVQAVNVHRIGVAHQNPFTEYVRVAATHRNNNENHTHGAGSTFYYGACLRSTVTILQMSPIAKKSPDRCRRNPILPFGFHVVKQSYLEYACRNEMLQWYRKCNFHVNYSGNPEISLELAKTWWSSGPFKSEETHSRQTRQAYLEFFDHACDDGSSDDPDYNDSPQYASEPGSRDALTPRRACHMSCSNAAEERKCLPVWVALKDMRQYALTALRQRLLQSLYDGVYFGRFGSDGSTSQSPLSEKEARPTIGWTASIHLAASELMSSNCSQINSDDDDTESSSNFKDLPGIYTGGVIMRSSRTEHFDAAGNRGAGDDELASASLADDQCILPVTVLDVRCGDKRVSLPSQGCRASFAFGRLGGVTASCICLGAAPGVKSSPIYQPKGDRYDSGKLSGSFNGRAQNHTGVTPAARQYASDKRRFGRTNPYIKKTSASDWNDCVEDFPHYDDIYRGTETIANPHHAPRSRMGSCALVHIEGFLFVVSMQLLFDYLVPFGSTLIDDKGIQTPSNLRSQRSKTSREPIYCTIQQCLDPETFNTLVNNEKDKSFVLGLLARPRFRLSKIRDNNYSGCVLTLSHIPVNFSTAHDQLAPSEIFCLQSIELKTAVCFKDFFDQKTFLCQKASRLLPPWKVLRDDLLGLALAWWKVADNEDSSSLAAGGWDHSRSQTSNMVSQTYLNELAVTVQFPLEAVSRDGTRGYKRFQCSLEQLKARITGIFSKDLALHGPATKQEASPRFLLNNVGGFKFISGMLDRRPRRRALKEDIARYQESSRASNFSLPSPIMGELMTLSPTSESGIPTCGLVDLLRCICLDLQNSTKNTNIAPSLVRRVSGARLLDISFCTVQVICMKCYKPLFQKRNEKQRHSNKNRGAAKKKYWGASNEPVTFWNNPLPIPNFESPDDMSAARSAASGVEVSSHSINWCCPRGCSVELYGASIKWECSGNLDGNTGQAKLRAESEVAVMLLGLTHETKQMIEEGAWDSKYGCVVFRRTNPPPSYICKAVEAANLKFRDYEKQRRHLHKSNQALDNQFEKRRALEFLDSAETRATYFLYQHCRLSPRPTRPLDYLVRCKPVVVAGGIMHLNHTEVEVVAPGPREGMPSRSSEATYSLPPLEVVLVDCCVASTSNNLVVEQTWDMIQLLKMEQSK
jgi:hypothetical protein